jgi:hypothetical protein
MREWDPIGVSDIPEAVDEYDIYIGDCYTLLARDASEDEINGYLRWVEISRIELPWAPEAKRKSAAAALKELCRRFPSD